MSTTVNTSFSTEDKLNIKKTMLLKIEMYEPKTSCVLFLFGMEYNLHELDFNALAQLLVFICSIKATAKSLGFEDVVLYTGYTLSEWEDDIINCMDRLTIPHIEKKIKELEEELEKEGVNN